MQCGCYPIRMYRRLCISLLAILISAKPTLACYPDPSFVYDDVSSQAVMIATATVTTVDLNMSKTSSCLTVRYSAAQFLYGNGSKGFSVTTCVDEIFQIDILSEESEGFEYFGFVPNAEVLVGLIHLHEDGSELRYAIPSCWGPLHINLNKMSTKKRAEFLQELESQIEITR